MTVLRVVDHLPEPVVTVTASEHDRFYRQFYGDQRWWVRRMTVEDYIAMCVQQERHELGG